MSYPAVAKLGLSFEELANPVWFQNDPHLAWAFTDTAWASTAKRNRTVDSGSFWTLALA